MREFKYILKPYRTPADRLQCPLCGKQRELSPYVDRETGELFSDLTGRCNRELHCGYHYKPADYFRDNGIQQERNISAQSGPAEKKIDVIPSKYIALSAAHATKSNFFKFFVSLFSESVANAVFAKYMVGTSNHWKGATLFPQIDFNGNFRQCKIILYNPETGKRVKKDASVDKYNPKTKAFESVMSDQDCSKVYGKYLSEETRSLSLEQCFFGEHLLFEFPEKRVAIVESEKTALIATVFYPAFCWLATGGSYGCKWTDYAVCKVLTGREVIMFPDCSIPIAGKPNFYSKWIERSQQIMQQVKCKIKVSDMLEKNVTIHQRSQGMDIADFLINQDEQFGWALTDHDYPVFWDYKIAV